MLRRGFFLVKPGNVFGALMSGPGLYEFVTTWEDNEVPANVTMRLVIPWYPKQHRGG